MLDYDDNKPKLIFMPAVEAFADRGALLKHHLTLCDFKLVCRGAEWPVHRTILILQSAVLEAACAGSFEEAKQACLDLSEEDIPVVAGLVHFMYNFNYDYDPYPRDAGGEQPDGPLTFHVKMFLLADYLDMAPLKMLATEKLSAKLQEGLGETAVLEISDIEQAATLAYKTRTVTKPLCVAFVAWLVIDAKPLEPESKYHHLEKLLKEVPDLAIDVIRATQMVQTHGCQPPQEVSLYHCRRCDRDVWADIEERYDYWCTYCGATEPGDYWIEREMSVEERTVEEAVKDGEWWRE